MSGHAFQKHVIGSGQESSAQTLVFTAFLIPHFQREFREKLQGSMPPGLERQDIFLCHPDYILNDR